MIKQIKLPVMMLLITAILFTFTACTDSNKEEGDKDVTTGGAQETTRSEGEDSLVFFNYSEGITDDGFWKDIKALDYVKLCEYIKISVPDEVHTITDDAVMYEIDSILSYYADYEEITDRAIVDGDTVNIDYVGSINGKEFSGGNTQGEGTEVTIGVTSYIDDFLEQLIGHKPGEKFDVEVTFPTNYGVEDLNGKDAVFAVTVNYILETKLPELSDQFVKDNLTAEYGWTDLQGMKDAIRDDLKRVALENFVQSYMLENSTVNSLPDTMIKYQEDSIIGYFEEYAQYNGMEYKDFITTYLDVSSNEELLEEYRENNEQMVAMFLILQAVAEDAKISVTNDDVSAYFIEYEGTSDYSPYEEIYGLPYLKLLVLNQEVINHIVENVTLS
ncbi:MAG TPA: hypothetical protein DDZ89_04140 [Clostridiales bacterium]|nr:hypothetical protein [Clostridiales bacterium]